MRTITQFAVGYLMGRMVTIIVLIVIGLLLADQHRPTKTPVPAQQAIEQRHREELLSQEYEEEQRQAEYAANPGAPYPTRGWQP